MKLIRKIVFIILGLFVLFFITGIFIAEKYEKVIINYFIKDINKIVKSEIRINKVDVTFIKKFPNISVWLKNSYIESQDKTISDTLLFVNDIYVQLDLFKLLKKEYEIKSVEISNGTCNLNISNKGEKNYVFWVSTENKNTALDLKLNKIKVNNLLVTYNNQLKLFNTQINIKNSILSGGIKKDHWSFDISQDLLLSKFELKKSNYITSPQSIQTKISVSSDSNNIFINHGNIAIDKTNFLVEGKINKNNIPELDLIVKGNKLNIKNATELLSDIEPVNYKSIKGDGNIDFQASLKGKISHNQLPHISGNFNLQGGKISFKKEKINVENINLTGLFDNHNKKTLDYSTLNINDFSYSIENKISKGNLLIENFHKPKIILSINGNTPIKLLEPILINLIDDVKEADGNISYNLDLEGQLNKINKVKKENIKYINIKGEIQLDNCNILLNSNLKQINNINGKFDFKDLTTINNLSFFINENDFLVNGSIKNLKEYVLDDANLNAEIDLFSNKIDVTYLISNSKKESKHKTNNDDYIFKLPENLIVNGNFILNNFVLGDFNARNGRGKMRYENKILTLHSVFFESMEGNINGGGVLAQTTDNTFSIKAQSNLHNINISEMMKSFHNFGQNIINENQISGALTGNITLSTRLYNNFKLDKNSISLNSYMEINNGRLANFTPLMGLSKFFRASELADIHFSRFENSIAISDKTIYFTDMKINSSVTDLLGSGIHSFDNSYEYKVKIKLSEILSGKIDKPIITESQFGEIEKEELKNTYIPIKISGVGDDYKVSPDFEETKKSIKTNIESKKQTIKTIFNEEFGKNKTDSTKSDTTKKKKAAFKIEWEEEEN